MGSIAHQCYIENGSAMRQQDPDTAILWKKPDGTSCVLRKRGAVLILSLLLFGVVQQEQPVDSPREVIELAEQWQSTSKS